MLRDDALKGKVIVVTGGGSGLGKAMTSIFLLGASAYYVKRLDKLKNTASELEAATEELCHTM
jgi:NAD(P)-dependent dehydrogenase (short-subunit alcohol dehydrogenase family)